MLIIDDEIYVVSLIEKLIDWHLLGMEIVGTANDGMDALTMVAELHPDIVIVDVRMPGYDGIKFMEKVREINHHVHFIVISGHKKFEYAKSAMKYNVEDYLLKPISKKELEHTLWNLRQKLETKQEDANTISQLDVSKNKLKYHLAELLLEDNKELLGQSVEQINDSYFTSLANGMFQCLLVKIDSTDHTMEKTHLQNLLSKMEAAISSSLTGLCKDIITITRDSCLWCFICCEKAALPEIHNTLKPIHRQQKSVLEKFENLYVTTTAGQPQDSFQKLPLSRRSAYRCVLSRTVLGVDRIITYDMIKEDPGTLEIVCADTRKKKLEDAIKSLSSEQIHMQIIEAFSRAEEYKYKNTLIFHEVSAFILNLFYEYVHSVQIYKGTKEELTNELYLTMQFACSGNEVSRILNQYLKRFIVHYVKENETGENPAVRIAKRYIADQYKNSISLNSMAKIVHLSPVYFSILFKKEEGINFLDYLNQYRIDISKKLLKDVKYNVNEVAGLCGFQDARYFSKLFKKNVGITPKEYRNRNIQ